MLGSEFGEHKQNIFQENIVRPNFQGIQSFNGNIFPNGLLLDTASNSLLACDDGLDNKGSVFQYSLSSGKLIKAYIHLQIQNVYSCVQFCRIVFFGGQNGCVRAINLDTRQIWGALIPTAVSSVFSLEVFPIQNRVFVAVVGTIPDYSNQKTDFLDVTALVTPFNC